MIEKNYAGLDGFVWWMGVVESRKDPLELGRCQVRVFGWHSPSLGDIPSEDLPWSVPVNSLNNTGFATPKEGDFVFGFFSDGRNAQVPLILGTIPSFAMDKSNLDAGFNDLRTPEELAAAPKKVVSRTYSKIGLGVSIEEEEPENYPKQRDLELPSTTGLATNAPNETHVVTSRKDRGPIAIPSAGIATYSTPEPSYAPVYPYNHAMETESGHSLEFDDTPGAERVEMAHRSGTMFEIQPNGTKVEEIVKDNYSVIMGDDYVYVMGKAIVSVDKDCTIKVTGNMKIQVGGDLELSAGGDVKISSGKDTKIASSDDVKINAKKTASFSGTASARVSSVGSTSVSGTASTSVSSIGRLSMSALTTSIKSLVPIQASQMVVAGSVAATGISSLSFPFVIPSFPLLEAIQSGITEFQALALSVTELTTQLTSLTALADIQSLMGSLDVAQLDGMLELAEIADVNKLVGSLGGEFGVDALLGKVSSAGLGSLVGKLDTSGLTGMVDKVTNLAGDLANQATKDLMNKLPIKDVQNFAKNLKTDVLNKATGLMDSAGVNKLYAGMSPDKIKESITSMGSEQVKGVLASMDGANLKKTFGSLPTGELSKLKGSLGFDLNKTINEKLASVGSGKKYPISIDFDIS